MVRTAFGLALALVAGIGCGSRTGVLSADPYGTAGVGGAPIVETPTMPRPKPDPGKPEPKPKPQPGVEVLSVAAGGVHSCAVLEAGLKCWGSYFFGVLGLGDREARGDGANEMGDRLPLVNVGSGITVEAVFPSTDAHTCALLSGGLVKCWGDNDFGQLGIEDPQDRGGRPGDMGDDLPFVNLGNGRRAQAIAAGANHTCAILEDSSLKCWGNNGNRQLGAAELIPRGAYPGQMGESLPSVDLGGDSVRQVAAGWVHTCALLQSGTVKCWGWGRGSEDDPVAPFSPVTTVEFGVGSAASQIAAGGVHSCAALNDATVRCWQPSEHAYDSPRLFAPVVFEEGAGVSVRQLGIGGRHGCALLASGSVQCWELGEVDGPPPRATRIQFGAGRSVVQMSASGTRESHHGCALLDDGDVKCWGVNKHGELGVGDVTPRAGTLDELKRVDLGTQPG